MKLGEINYLVQLGVGEKKLFEAFEASTLPDGLKIWTKF